MSAPKISTEALKAARLKAGEYQLHVLIEATANLTFQDQSSIDALISIKAFGQSQYTKVKHDVGIEEVFWGEHFFFSREMESREDAETQIIEVSVWDHNKVLRDGLVGSYSFDASRVYTEKSHALEHIWLALARGDEENEVAGYVKLSASMIGENDTEIELIAELNTSPSGEKKILLPPHIEKVSYELTADIIEGRNLRPADGDTVDSYIGVEFGQIYEKTEPVIANNNPKYNFRLHIPLILPSVNDHISLRLCDYNFIQANEVLGSYYINVAELMEEGRACENNRPNLVHANYHWVHLYGPQNDSQRTEQKQVYQKSPAIASSYVGSLLVKFVLARKDHPEIKKEEIERPPLRPPVPLAYHVQVRIFAGLNLYDRNKRHQVLVKVANESIVTEAVEARNGFCLWLVEKAMKVVMEDHVPLPDVFVYLLNSSGTPVCFLRTPYEGQEVLLKEAWHSLVPDISMVSYKNEEAGLVKVELRVVRKEKHQFYDRLPPNRQLQSKMQLATLTRPKGLLAIDLISAEELLPLDEEGVSDPFFTFAYNLNEVTSSVKNATLSPVYFEKLLLPADIEDKPEDQFPIIVTCYDQDALSRELIGSFFIDVNLERENGSVAFQGSRPPVPRWFTLYNRNAATGKVLLAITIYPFADSEIPRSIEIPFKIFKISLYILGLRGLKTDGFIAVKKPFLELDFESLNVYGHFRNGRENRNVITEPLESGPSVNIKSNIQSTIALPCDRNYWPTLSGKVSHSVLSNLYTPLIGFFSLDLKRAFIRSLELRREFASRLAPKAKPREMDKLALIHPDVLRKIRSFLGTAVAYRWRLVAPGLKYNRVKSEEHFDKNLVVVMPNYEEMEQRQVERHRDVIAEHRDYIRVGYDKKHARRNSNTSRNKHYRFALESTYEAYYAEKMGFKMGIFDELDIRKGRQFAETGLLSSLTRKVSQADAVVGKYKGNCFISEETESPSLEDQKFEEHALRSLKRFMKNINVIMFLYILEAFDLPAKDINGLSDPYLKVIIGEETLDFSKERILETKNPQFNKVVKKNLVFPQHSSIEIQVWDYDAITFDEFIGSAVIDIENRVLSQLGKYAFNNPIELYKLETRQSRLAQGTLRLWVDLVDPTDLPLYREFDISQPPPAEFEVRVVVWNISEMQADTFDGAMDFFVSCTFADQTQETDVHFRSTSSFGSFNWRMKFPVALPVSDPTLTFRVFDKDLITRNEFLGSCTLDLREQLEEAQEFEETLHLFLGEENLKDDGLPILEEQVGIHRRYNRFKLDLIGRNAEHEGGVAVTGSIMVSVSIVAKSDFEKQKNANGREDPNKFPTLPPPTGRISFSLNPLVFLNQVCGPKLKRRLLCVLIIGLIIFIAYNISYSLVGSVIANRIS